jgi:hypothetical protein
MSVSARKSWAAPWAVSCGVCLGLKQTRAANAAASPRANNGDHQHKQIEPGGHLKLPPIKDSVIVNERGTKINGKDQGVVPQNG